MKAIIGEVLWRVLPRRFKPVWCPACYGWHWRWERLVRCDG